MVCEKTADGVIIRAAAGETEQPAPAVSNLASFDLRYRDHLLARLRSGPAAPGGPKLSFDRTTLLASLRAHRVPDSLANALAAEAEKSGLGSPMLALSSALDRRMRVTPLDFAKPGAVLLVGPYGAGKTCVAAKLAAAAKGAGATPRLIATDVESAGQLARLETFAQHLQTEVQVAPTPPEFAKAIAEGRKDGAFVIADSAGCDPRRLPQSIASLADLGSVEVIGVVSAAGDAEDLAGVAASLKDLGAARLILTCLDLAQRKGALAAFAASGLDIAHTAASPYLVDGLDSPTPLSFARALLAPIGGHASEALG